MKRNSLFLLLPLAVSGVLGGCGASRYVPAAVSVHDTCHVYSHVSDTLWIADSVIIDRTRDSVVYHREVRREYRHSAVRDTVYMVRRDTVSIIREGRTWRWRRGRILCDCRALGHGVCRCCCGGGLAATEIMCMDPGGDIFLRDGFFMLILKNMEL